MAKPVPNMAANRWCRICGLPHFGASVICFRCRERLEELRPDRTLGSRAKIRFSRRPI